MAIIKQDYGTIGGGINPIEIKSGCIVSGSSITQQLNLTKTYIMSISANVTSNSEYMNVFMIKKGEVSQIHTSTGGSTDTITVDSSGILYCSVSSAYASRSYCIIQLD